MALADLGGLAAGHRAAPMVLMQAAAGSGQWTTPAWLTLAVAALVPLAALAGVLASLRIETKRSRDAREREREMRLEERALRAADYQRETLHDLQEALGGLLRAAMERFRPESKVDAVTGVMSYVDASHRVVMLTARLQDQPSRAAVGQVLTAIKGIEKEGFADASAAAMAAVRDAQRAIGDALRTLP